MAEDTCKGEKPEDDIKKLVQVEQREGEEVHLQKVTGDGDDPRCHDESKIGGEQVTDPILNRAGYFVPHEISLTDSPPSPNDELEAPPHVREWEGYDMHQSAERHKCEQQEACQEMYLVR